MSAPEELAYGRGLKSTVDVKLPLLLVVEHITGAHVSVKDGWGVERGVRGPSAVQDGGHVYGRPWSLHSSAFSQVWEGRGEPNGLTHEKHISP